jgi:FdrA protein
VGLVAASGTGLQQVTSRLHQLGSGITHALGTGGRDLSQAVGAITSRQALDLLSRDPDTKVIVVISKPPSPQVAADLLAAARSAAKPVVVDLIGYCPPSRRVDNLAFAATFGEAAELAAGLAAGADAASGRVGTVAFGRFSAGQRYLRGLYSGGTLAYEALLLLQDYLPAAYSNAPLNPELRLPNSLVSQAHTIVDLGEDEFTVGRLHPMMDNDLRIRRLQQEADDPEVAVILLDVVLGYGAHPDPAAELGPAIAEARAAAARAGRTLEVIAVVVGTDEDPQNLESQIRRLAEAGARVETSNEAAVRVAGRAVRSLNPQLGPAPLPPVDLAVLGGSAEGRDQGTPLSAINVGLESFAESLTAQGAAVVQVDWRPPAGGNERLMAILERMKRGK